MQNDLTREICFRWWWPFGLAFTVRDGDGRIIYACRSWEAARQKRDDDFKRFAQRRT